MAAQAVGDQRVDHLGHVVHEATVTRGERAHGGLGVAHPGQAGQVLVQVTVGRADHHGRAVHDVVARHQQRVLLDQPAQVVRGVPRGVQRPQGEARRGRAGSTQPSPTRSSG